MSYNQNLGTLNDKVALLIASNKKLEDTVESLKNDVREMKTMLASFVGQHTVSESSPGFVVEHVGDVNSDNTRPRDTPKQFIKVIRPSGGRIRPRQRVQAFVDQKMKYRYTDGRVYPEDLAQKQKKNEVDSLVKLTNTEVLAMRVRIARKYPGQKFKWSEVPEEDKLECANAIEEESARRGVFIDRCVDQWAARGLMSENYSNNGNPRSTNSNKNKKRKRVENEQEQDEDEEEQEQDEEEQEWEQESEHPTHSRTIVDRASMSTHFKSNWFI